MKIVKWSAWISGALACIFIFVSQYDVWIEERELREKEVAKEREKREAEQAKNERPEIQGEVFMFSAQGIRGESSEVPVWVVESAFPVICICAMSGR